MPAKRPTRPKYARNELKHVADDSIRVSSPPELLALVPSLLGFEPADCIVIVGTREYKVVVTLRYEIPDSKEAPLIAAHAASLFDAANTTAACVVGYGAGECVTPAAEALRSWFDEAGITVSDLLRAEDGRYWSYLCTDTDCCPAEGTPFSLEPRPPGLRQPVLASREELVATLAPAGGQVAATMRRATAKAHADITRCVAGLDKAGTPITRAKLTATLGQVAVRDAINCYRGGGKLTAKAAATLTVALRQLRVRDDAWARMHARHRKAHLRLWTDLTRLARPGYVAAPASLLAFCAWQDGNGALANVALDRALEDNPKYSMARLLRQALDAGAPPSMARLPMTPEEVADAYDAADKDAAARPAGDTASEENSPGSATPQAEAEAAD